MFDNLFGKKKPTPEPEDDNGFDEIPERKKTVYPVFGFRCMPALHMKARVQAKSLNVDTCVLAEHAIQLGLNDIEEAMKDPEETENLRKHLIEYHAINHLAESVANYDNESAEYIREGQIRKFHKEKAIRDLVELWTRYNYDPLLMKEIIIQELQRRAAFMRQRAAQQRNRQDVRNAENEDRNTSKA
jgi:hypothetical protein